MQEPNTRVVSLERQNQVTICWHESNVAARRVIKLKLEASNCPRFTRLLQNGKVVAVEVNRVVSSTGKSTTLSRDSPTRNEKVHPVVFPMSFGCFLVDDKRKSGFFFESFEVRPVQGINFAERWLGEVEPHCIAVNAPFGFRFVVWEERISHVLI